MGFKMGAMFLEQGKGLVNRTEYEARETLSMDLTPCSFLQPGPKATDVAYSANGASPYLAMESSFGRSSLDRVATPLNRMKFKNL